MAKRLKKKPVPTEGSDKVRIELRFDPDVYEGIKKLADDAQISVNQLMQGLSRWAAGNAKLGDPVVTDDKFVTSQDRSRFQPGAIWFGREGMRVSLTRSEMEDLARENMRPVDDFDNETRIYDPGSVFFRLDFTERRVVRED